MTEKSFVSNRRIITLFIATLLLATPILSQEFVDDYLQGRKDGRHEGASDASLIWAVAGFGCSCCGVGAAYLWTQTVPTERLIGKSPEYVSGYASNYKKVKREWETIYAAVGCVLANVIGSITVALRGI